MIKDITDQVEKGKSFSQEQTDELANQWMSLADTDGNKLIDLDEFKEFVKKLDTKNQLDDSQITSLFKL